MNKNTMNSTKQPQTHNSEFQPWVTPMRLILKADGRLKMDDGSSVQAYLKRFFKSCPDLPKPLRVVLCHADHYDTINLPHSA